MWYLADGAWMSDHFSNYTAHEDIKERADAELRRELGAGLLAWAADRRTIENKVGPLRQAKIAAILKDVWNEMLMLKQNECVLSGHHSKMCHGAQSHSLSLSPPKSRL